VVVSLEAVDLLLVLIRHASHAIVMLTRCLIHPLLVSHVDLFNSVQVILLSLCGTLSQRLDLRTKGISLSDELVLVAIVLAGVLSDLNGSVCDVGLQFTTLNL
jgi:hypothetical protein